MRRLVTAAVLGLVLALAVTSIADSAPTPTVSKAKKKCFKKKHGKRVRVKCPKKRKKQAPTPTTPTPRDPTPTNPTPTGGGDVTGQPAIDQMTKELKDGQWVYFTSGYDSSTKYVLNLCSDGTFLRTAESVGVQTFRYGTWKVTEAVIFGDGSGRGAHVVGTTTQSDPPGAENVDATLAFRTADSQWFWGENATNYTAGAARCS